MTDPPLGLTYGVNTPAVVRVTVDPLHPLDQTVTFNFVNTSGAAIALVNPDGLTPSDPLPAFADAAPNPLSRVYVWFPWGDGGGDLATDGNATSIVASSSQSDWDVSKQLSDPTLGYYWILFPKSKSVFLEVNESVEFTFAGIVTQLPPGVTTSTTWVQARSRVAGYAPAAGTVEIDKNVDTATLTAPATAVPGDRLTIEWQTVGVDSCELDPGDFPDLGPDGQKQVTMPPAQSATWTLTAYPHDGTSPIYASATVTAQTGWIDLGAVPNPADGSQIFLRLTDAFLLVQGSAISGLAGCWTSPDGSAWTRAGSLPTNLVDCFATASGGRALLFALDLDNAHQVVYSTPDGVDWTAVDGPSWGAPWVSWPPVDVQAATPGGALWALVGSGVWSSRDGATWTAHAAPPWGSQPNPPVPAAFAGALWAFAGESGSYSRGVWSTVDGETWTAHAEAPWDAADMVVAAVGTRSVVYVVTAAPDGSPRSLWLMDRDQNWSSAALPAELGTEPDRQLAFVAWNETLVGLDPKGHLWRYAPPVDRAAR
jgi:hypothetical protein